MSKNPKYYVTDTDMVVGAFVFFVALPLYGLYCVGEWYISTDWAKRFGVILFVLFEALTIVLFKEMI